MEEYEVRVWPAALAAAVLAVPSAACAQGRPVELGIDGGVGFDLSGSNTVSVGIPMQAFRVGGTIRVLVFYALVVSHAS